MFAGLRSRWMTPFWCPWCTAAQTCAKSFARPRASSFRPRAYSVIVRALGMYSIAKYGTRPEPPSQVPASYTVAMDGWCIRPRICDSYSNRRSADGEAMPSFSTLSATVRRGWSWRARYTAPMPPEPMRRLIW